MSLATLNAIAARHQGRWGKTVLFRGETFSCIVRQTPEVWPDDSSLWDLSDQVAYIPIGKISSIPKQNERITINGVNCNIVSANLGEFDYIIALKAYKTNT